MDLDLQLSWLEITPRRNKRRLSGLHKVVDPHQLEDMLQEETEEEVEGILDETDMVKGKEVHNLRRSGRGRTPDLKSEPSGAAVTEKQGSKLLNVKDDMKEIKKIYLNASKKLKNPSLETIFEDPTGDDKIMSKKKLKRTLTFVDHATRNKLKSKKRLMKAKKVTAKKRKDTKVSMEYFMQKLQDLDSEKE